MEGPGWGLRALASDPNRAGQNAREGRSHAQFLGPLLGERVGRGPRVVVLITD